MRLIKSALFLFCLTFLCMCCGYAKNQQPPLIKRDIFFGNPSRLSPMISPDGTQLAYLAPDQNGVLNVWLHDLHGEKKDQCLTFEKKRGIPAFCWQYDGKHILYKQDQDGDENWHYFQTEIATKTTKDLTPFQNVAASIVAYQRHYPDEILIQLNKRDPTLFDVYRLNLKEGSLTIDVENRENVVQWLADYKLQIRASASYDAQGQTLIRVRPDEHSAWYEVMRWGAEDEGELIAFSPDGNALYFLSNKDSNTTQLRKLNLTDNQIEVIASDPDYDLLADVMIDPISHQLQAIGVDREYFEWILLDPALEGDFKTLAKQGEEMRVINRDGRDEQWTIQYMSDCYPPHYYLYDRTNKTNLFLFNSQPKLDPALLSAMTPISYKARDGMQLYGYLTLPLGKKPKNLPTILLVHGGPWHRDTWGYSASVQWLANRGYAVLQVNFRGSTGYGKAYLNAGNREWAGKMHTDLLDAKEWLVKKGIANPDKVALFGGSYGGYATLVGLTYSPKAFCCGIDLVGPSNLVSLLETIPPYWTPLISRFNTRVGNIKTEKAFLESQSPLFKADKICKPLLIAQGAKDPRVKQAESDQIVAAMRKNHQEVEYLLIPDEGHGFKRPENRLKFFSAAEKFLHKYMGGRLEE